MVNIAWDEDAAVYLDGSRHLLEPAFKNANSIENMAGHGAEGVEVEYIGTVQKKNRLYLLYMDSVGGYWYKTLIQTPQGSQTLYQAIFGRKEKIKHKF